MRLKGSSIRKDASAVTIDDIDAANTPALVAYYKGTEGGGDTLLDYSGNGLHIALDNKLPWTFSSSGASGIGIAEEDWRDRSFQTVEECRQYRPGYFTFAPNMEFSVDVVGTPLDTLGNYVIWAGEFILEKTISTDGIAAFLQGGLYRSASDIDLGTAWDFTPGLDGGATNDYSGFTFPMALDSWWARAAFPGDVRYDTPAGLTLFSVAGEEVAFSAGFRPGVDVRSGINGQVTNTVLTETSLTAQDGKFGISSAGGLERVLFRNIQVWSFKNEPVEMLTTVEWMGLNPGKIPPWWIGR